MEDKEEISQDLEEVIKKLTPKQKKVILWSVTIGTFVLMMVILVYMIYYVNLLNTHPCELCYSMTRGLYQTNLNITIPINGS